MTPFPPLQIVAGFGWLVLAFFLSAAVVALGTYVGVLVALQSSFGASSWAAVERAEPADGSARADQEE